VCVTPFDVKRIQEETGMQPEEFLDLIPDYKGRERNEPAILIDREYSILILKREIDDKCFFYTKDGCRIYGSRPMLCRTYPFKLNCNRNCLDEMKSRSCIESWTPNNKEKQQYLDNCKQYEKQIEEYRQLAKEWNKLGGTLKEFLDFLNLNCSG
jgi:Fe-S-cluster containining protein